jgi:Na+/H+ antiporter NhaA
VEPLPLAILLGLFLGKQGGVMLAAALASARHCAPPAGASWSQFTARRC